MLMKFHLLMVHLRDVNKAVLVYPDVDESSEIRNIRNDSRQLIASAIITPAEVLTCGSVNLSPSASSPDRAAASHNSPATPQAT